MNDKELADRTVALGVGTRADLGNGCVLYAPPNEGDLDEREFVRDWRVAGAMMEKWCGEYKMTIAELLMEHGYDAIDPRAINEACVEALE